MSDGTDARRAERKFSPEEIAALVRSCREDRGWTQETLAEISSLTVRTIQRVENAEPSSFDTRRAIARAFEFEDIDAFNKLYKLDKILRQAEDFLKNYITLDAFPAKTGKQLADLVERSTMYVFKLPENASPDVIGETANLYDLLKDYGDIHDEYSYEHKSGLYEEVGRFLYALKQLDYSICYAVRKTALASHTWVDKTPWQVTVAYVFAVPVGHEPKSVWVPKALD